MTVAGICSGSLLRQREAGHLADQGGGYGQRAQGWKMVLQAVIEAVWCGRYGETLAALSWLEGRQIFAGYMGAVLQSMIRG